MFRVILRPSRQSIKRRGPSTNVGTLQPLYAANKAEHLREVVKCGCNTPVLNLPNLSNLSNLSSSALHLPHTRAGLGRHKTFIVGRWCYTASIRCKLLRAVACTNWKLNTTVVLKLSAHYDLEIPGLSPYSARRPGTFEHQGL